MSSKFVQRMRHRERATKLRKLLEMYSECLRLKARKLEVDAELNRVQEEIRARIDFKRRRIIYRNVVIFANVVAFLAWLKFMTTTVAQ